MGKQASKFTVVGRYVNEKDERDVVGYQLKSDETGKTARFGVDQMCMLVGKERINDVQAQIYKDKVLFRGQNGLELGKLPAIKVAVKTSGKVANKPEVTANTSDKKGVNIQTEVTKTLNNKPDTLKMIDENMRKHLGEAFDHAYKFFSVIDITETSREIKVPKDLDEEDDHYIGKIIFNSKGIFDIVIRINQVFQRETPADAEVVKYNYFSGFSMDIHVNTKYGEFARGEVFKEALDVREEMFRKSLVEMYDMFKYWEIDAEPKKHEVKGKINVLGYYNTQNQNIDGIDYGVTPSEENVSVEEAIQLYDKAIAKLEGEYLKQAYNMDNLDRFVSSPKHTMLNIDSTDMNLCYVSINKWGFDPDTKIPGSRDKLIVSKTTVEIIESTFKGSVTHNKTDVNVSEYARAHYHDIVIRLRQFEHIPDFKKLRVLYNKLNKEVFGDKLSNNVIVTVGNYSNKTEGSVLDHSLDGCTAYHHNSRHYIVFNADHFRLQDKKIDGYMEAVMIHEMCHEYADRYLGGALEPEETPETWGDALYGLDRELYGFQVRYHGAKFGKAVKMAAEKSKHTFEEIFGYGLDKGKRALLKSGLPDKNESIRNVGASGWRGWVKKDNNAAKVIQEVHNYDKWFKDKMNCGLKIEQEGTRPIFLLNIHSLIGDFSEMYRLNFNDTYGGSDSGKIGITLLRDYQDEGRGYKIKTFVMNTDEDLPNVIRNILGHIKTDIQSV